MYKKIAVLIFFLITLSIRAQENGGNGRIKLKNGSEITGYIVLDDSYRTPNSVSISFNDEIQNYTPEEVLLVEIDDRIYISNLLEIDRTNVDLNSITGTINEESVTKHVFLKKVVEGDVSLFTYKDSRVHYFALKNNEFVELIRIPRYHRNGKSNPYNKYLGQLTILLSDCLKQERINKVVYSFSSLKNVIKEYNVCKNGGSSYVQPKTPVRLSVFLVAGYTNTDFSISREIEGKRKFFKNESASNATFGIAVDFNIFKNTERLKLYNELMYQSYDYEVTIRDEQAANFYVDYTTVFDVDYLELTNSIRYFLSKKSGLNPYIGLNLTSGFAVSNKSSEETYLFFYDTERASTDSFNGGIKKYGIAYSLSLGVKYKGLNIEGRYGYNPKMSKYPTVTNGTTFQLLLQFKIL